MCSLNRLLLLSHSCVPSGGARGGAAILPPPLPVGSPPAAVTVATRGSWLRRWRAGQCCGRGKFWSSTAVAGSTILQSGRWDTGRQRHAASSGAGALITPSGRAAGVARLKLLRTYVFTHLPWLGSRQLNTQGCVVGRVLAAGWCQARAGIDRSAQEHWGLQRCCACTTCPRAVQGC